MKFCKHCHIQIKTPAEVCPLCGNEVIGDNRGIVAVYPVFRKMNIKEKQQRHTPLFQSKVFKESF